MKRILIIVGAFLLVFVLFCIGASAECGSLSCTKANIGCDNNSKHKIAVCGSNMCGFRCEGENQTCEWFPLWFGLDQGSSCIQPVIGGIGVCSCGPVNSGGTFSSEDIPQADDIPVTKEVTPLGDGDYTVNYVTYTLRDDISGEEFSSGEFSALLKSDLFKDLREKAYSPWYEHYFDQTFSFYVDINLDAQMTIELETSASLYLDIYSNELTGQRPSSRSFIEKTKVSAGEGRTVRIAMTEIELIYAQRTYEISIGDVAYAGTKTVYMRGDGK